MMAGLFLLFAIAMILLFIGYRKTCFILAFATLILCAFMLIHHADSVLGIRL